MVARALGTIKDRLRIEVCVGDVVAVLEQIQHGMGGHRKQTSEQRNPRGPEIDGNLDMYPQLYDRIHLSNIPDYIGGTLSSYLYALPMIHPGDSSYITSTNLRNPAKFGSIAEFDNEYVALSAHADLAKVFKVRVDQPADQDTVMPTCTYYTWHHEPDPPTAKNLMPRAKLETWLQRLFFKIMMPREKQKIVDQNLIFSPLNVTVFFRLLIRLFDVGYLAHWFRASGLKF
jgi:hypothetical protein